MTSTYPDDIQFAGLVEAATAAADAQRDLGKRKRGEENAYISVSTDLAFPEQLQQPQPTPKTPTLNNSAAVLFREPSEKSKKYSRPPLGKVFTSLELAPEPFLQLQNAAKAYMLSDEHPERRDVVGHKKHNNNNDVAKLKLYECVEEFLRLDDVGEKYFGQSTAMTTPEGEPRTFFWPEDKNRIVKLLMPLLRKMVTNERQRVYAAETRKQDPKKIENKDKADKIQGDGDIDTQMTAGEMASEIDPSLQQESKAEAAQEAPDSVGTDLNQTISVGGTGLILKVNVVTVIGGLQKRIIPEFDISSEAAGTFEEFLEEFKQRTGMQTEIKDVSAWVPQGVTSVVSSPSDWSLSQMIASGNDWMDGQLKIIVEVVLSNINGGSQEQV